MRQIPSSEFCIASSHLQGLTQIQIVRYSILVYQVSFMRADQL